MNKHTTLTVPEEIRSYLAHKVETGEYKSEADALLAIVHNQMDADLALAYEREQVAIGIADDDAGRYVDENFEDFVARKKREHGVS